MFGLKWQDVDFTLGQITVVRSLVNGIEGQPKTATSRRPVPLTKELADVLQGWRGTTPYAAESDWVWGSHTASGKAPYWPDSVLYKRIRPAAQDAGITKQIGWHSFRRTTASLLLANGASIRTAQELMRHASTEMTVGVYAQSLSSERLIAQARLTALLSAQGTQTVPACSVS